MNMGDSIPHTVDAALRCAAQGWHVFPARIVNGAKKSHKSAKHSDGRKWGATTDSDEIRRDWKQWPDAMLGIVTGPKSGFFVIEADTEDGHGVDGIGNLRDLLQKHDDLPKTIEAESPSGSRHFYFRWSDDAKVKNSAGKIAPGIDVRGDGGMVIAPPSYRADKGRGYRWLNPPGDFDLADCPPWLLSLATASKKRLSDRAKPSDLHGVTSGAEWGEAALRGEIAALLDAQQGGRNDALNRAAFRVGQVVGGGHLDHQTAQERLVAAAAGIGLDAAEIAPTIASGLSAGMQEPRNPEIKTTSNDPRPNAADEIDLSQDALASDLGVRGFDNDARHVATWGKWLFWDGTRWEIDDRLGHMTRTREFVRLRAAELTAWADRKAKTLTPDQAEKVLLWAEREARALRSQNTVAAVVSLARANPASVARADAFDGDLLLLGTPGGTVDLRTGALRPARRGDMITKLTACAPAVPGSHPTRWLTFLHEIFDGDRDVIAFVQRVAGYALTGLTTEHKLLFLYGTGRNGKSVFLNTLTHIWGDYARRAAAETFLDSHGQKHATGIAGLQGARLVVGSELPKGRSWDESVIKDLTGGDRMSARFMRGDFFDFDPHLTLMIAGNNMPSFSGVDEAIRARVVLVPFFVTIPPERRDKGLSDKLRAEAPAILRWAIDGALAWQRQGLDVPATVAAASEDYMSDEDTLGQFLADETELDPHAFTTTSDLHQRFSLWCERQGLSPWTQRTLHKELKTRGLMEHRRNHGRGFMGLRVKK